MRQISDIKLIIVVLDMCNIIFFHFYVVFVEIIANIFTISSFAMIAFS